MDRIIISLMLDDLIASVQMFKIASNVHSFEIWLQEHHNIPDFTSFFEGYRYFIFVCSVSIFDAVMDDQSLQLEEDRIYQHALGSVNLDDLPNSCEKAVALKNIWNYVERIHSAENKEELILAIHRMQDVTGVFQKIIDLSEVNSNGSKERAREYVLLSYVFRNLNDTRAGFPAGARSILLDRSLTQPGVEDLQGYAYALEYIWFQLLGKQKFEGSPAKELHKAPDLLNADDYKILKGRNRIAQLIYSADPERGRLTAGWEDLDSHYSEFYDLHIKPLETRWRDLEPVFRLPPRYEKSTLSLILDRTKVKEPRYFINLTDEESHFKLIDYYFTWLPVNFLDTQKIWDFSGVYAFIPFLYGVVKHAEKSGDEKVAVLRIRHPVEGIAGYFYSYAVLNNSSYYGGVGQGWIVFLTCGTDYSGHGSKMRDRVESCIRTFLEEGSITVRQIDVDEDYLKKYLVDKVGNANFEENIPLELLIQHDESEKLEFKSSMLWSYIDCCCKKTLIHDIVRSIASFLNSNGGTLVIGVKDGEALGLERDYSCLGDKRHQNSDGFERRLNEGINTMLGRDLRQYISVEFQKDSINNEVCIVNVAPSPEPVFVNKGEREFFIRSGNSSQKLDIFEFHKYAQKHWGSLKK